MRDLNGMGPRRSAEADEKHSNCPQFYRIKHIDDGEKIASQVTFFPREIELTFQEAHALFGNEHPDPLG